MSKHPFIENLLQRIAGMPALSSGTPHQARELLAAGRSTLGDGPRMYQSTELFLSTRSGPLPARLHIPFGEVKGILVYVHGGGWVLGSIDDFDTLGRTIAERSRCAVLLPEYRLAPEHPFPAGLNDAEDAILHIADRSVDLFGKQLPIIVAGDSAGANLATVAARKLAAKADIALQVLIYPVTDCRFDTPSYVEHASGLPLSAKDMEWFFELYAPRDRWCHPDISPLRSNACEGLPPTLVITAEYDVLECDGQAYARHLMKAGVQTEYRLVPGVTHGFIRLHNLFDVADAELNHIAAACSAALNKRMSVPVEN